MTQKSAQAAAPAARGPDRGQAARSTTAPAAIGNQAMQALARSGIIRPRLELGAADAPEERQADSIANQVMGGGNCDCCPDCATGSPAPVRRLPDSQRSDNRPVPPGTEQQIHDVTRGGEPLPLQLRSFFEPRIGSNLDAVRVHRDAAAGDAAHSIGARAFALGGHIAFAPGQWAPDTNTGRQLIAHELAHVQQDGGAVRRDGPVGAPAASPPPDAATVSKSVDVIIDALEGYTSGADSENILNQFRGKGAATVLALVQEVKTRGTTHSKTADEMVDWLLGDLTEENRRELRHILTMSRSPDIERIVAHEIKDRLEGYTSEGDSAEIYGLFSGFSGVGIDGLLTRLETDMHQSRDVMRDQVFGDLDRVNAERLRQLFFAQGGPIGLTYAAGWTAGKIFKLLDGYTGHADSTDVVWNFSTTPQETRSLVQYRLNSTYSAQQQSAEDVLMRKLDASDYERLRGMVGLTLAPYKDLRSTGQKVLSAADWVLKVAEWTTCGVIGIATGLVSAIWDIVKGIKDIVVAVWDLIWSLVYLLSFGAAGSENWLKVKTFFTGIGNLLSDPGKVWDDYWDNIGLEFHTIEGTLSDCRRAEFVVRKFVGALVNVALIFVAGYGIAKGVVAGAKALAEGAELAEIIGVRGVIAVAGRIATRRIGRFVAVSEVAATELLNVIRQPVALLRTIGTRIRTVLIAAEDAGYWRYLRQQGGAAVQAGTDAANEQLAGERKFWEDNRRFWRERAEGQQAREQDLGQDLSAVQEHLATKEQPDPPTVVGDLKDDATQLDAESAGLESEVAGRTEPSQSSGAAASPPVITTTADAVVPGSPQVDIGKLIEEALGDYEPPPAAPLDPAAFGPPARRVVGSLREIALEDIPPSRRGYFEAAYPGYVQRRTIEIARGIRPGLRILSRDDYVRYRWGRESGILIQTAGGPLDLRGGWVERGGGRVLERVVDTRLPGSSNTTPYPNPYGDPVIPDHLPPGSGETFLDRRGFKANTGQRFSARFVGDSKYKDFISLDDQARGFVNLARFSDEQTLVYFVRWQEGFPAADSLAFDPGYGGRVLPVRPWNEQLISPGLRDFARQRGVKIRLVSDPQWR